ncbi:DUF5333 domain-containing protein [uncultured Shimia sp.]|uniref:DUF5333 domain-containing protein n=1 Tax=uncultured Shimia sp. TaxID=573152 RepID=UPI00260E54C6|nr:DUF5333 domain-containing protein [uncultured Shimia sp.]
MIRVTSVVVAATLALSGATAAKPPLREVKEISDPLYWALVAYELSEHCDTIEPRKLKGVADGWGLVRKARKLGYTDEEIKAFIKSDEEKERMRQRGDAFLQHKGVSLDDPESVCALGRAEIERNSAIGVYLRAK